MAKQTDPLAEQDFDRDLSAEGGADYTRDTAIYRQPSPDELRAGILRLAPDGSDAEAVAIASEALKATDMDRALGEALSGEDIVGIPFRLIGWKWNLSDEGNQGSAYYAVMTADFGDGMTIKGEQAVTCGARPVVTFLLWLQENGNDPDNPATDLPAFAFQEKVSKKTGNTVLRLRRADRK